MKRLVVLTLLLVMAVGFVAASFSITGYSFGGSFSPYENITGTLNISIDSEDFFSKITSSDDEEIFLGTFLDSNFADYTCFPNDCSQNYGSNSPETSKTVAMTEDESSYIGFVLDGVSVSVNSLSFAMSSDFVQSLEIPLSLTFFEGDVWEFTIFSSDYAPKNYGCYNPSSGVAGHLIQNSEYCEVIQIPVTSSIQMGAIVDINSETRDLTMTLYPGEVGFEIDSCTFNPSIDPTGCTIDAAAGTTFNEEIYHVCVSAPVPTSYKIFEETFGETCGFVLANGAGNSVIDYGIFAQSAYYEGAVGFLDSSSLDFDSLALHADAYIESRYNRDCSNSCVLPLRLDGVSQNFVMDSISVGYSETGGDVVLDAVSDLDVTPATVDFEGTLDLSKTGFKISETGNYSLYLDGEKLLEEYVTLLSVPFVNSLSPLSVPAGIEVLFTAQISYDGNDTVDYLWDFGDGTTFVSVNNSVMHTYGAIKNYTVGVTARTTGNLESSSSFVVDAVSPEMAVDTTLVEKNNSLAIFSNELDLLDSWIGSKLRADLDYDSLVTQLTALESRFENYSSEAELINLAEDVYGLDVPVSIGFGLDLNTGLTSNVNSLNPFAVAEIENFDLQNAQDYSEAILNWQQVNTNSRISRTDYIVTSSSGSKETAGSSYVIDITSLDDDSSYIVLGPLSSSVQFKEADYIKTSDGSYVFELGGHEQKMITVYSSSDEALTAFVSPKLSSLVIGSVVDETCNFNNVCESEKGENSKTCRSDCAPTEGIIFFSIAALLFVLVLYILLAWWYERNYESHLFKDRRQLYNLLMFATNARSNNIEEGRIVAALRKQGWSKERIAYVLKKSLGKRTGLPQVILVTWIALYFRRRKARKLLHQTQKLVVPSKNIVSQQRLSHMNQNQSPPFVPAEKPRPSQVSKKSQQGTSSATQDAQKDGQNINKSK